MVEDVENLLCDPVRARKLKTEDSDKYFEGAQNTRLKQNLLMNFYGIKRMVMLMLQLLQVVKVHVFYITLKTIKNVKTEIYY